jgi:hypothetical protein
MFVHPLDLTSIVFHIFALFNAVKRVCLGYYSLCSTAHWETFGQCHSGIL